MQYFTLFNVIAFSIRENNNQEIQRYDLDKEVNHKLIGISKWQKNYGSKWLWKQLMICEKKVVGFTVYMVRGKYYTV